MFGLLRPRGGEYLDRLDALLQPPAAPAAEELVRLARALRGSALMASQQGIARAATGLEAFARGVREGRRPWDAATKQIAIRAVDDLKIFVRKAASWTEADTAKAEALASQLEQFGGRPSAQVRAAEAIGLDAGARAFVAREGAAIASALDRAGRALRTNPMAHDPLQLVLESAATAAWARRADRSPAAAGPAGGHRAGHRRTEPNQRCPAARCWRHDRRAVPDGGERRSHMPPAKSPSAAGPIRKARSSGSLPACWCTSWTASLTSYPSKTVERLSGGARRPVGIVPGPRPSVVWSW